MEASAEGYAQLKRSRRAVKPKAPVQPKSVFKTLPKPTEQKPIMPHECQGNAQGWLEVFYEVGNECVEVKKRRRTSNKPQ